MGMTKVTLTEGNAITSDANRAFIKLRGQTGKTELYPFEKGSLRELAGYEIRFNMKGKTLVLGRQK